MKMDRFFNFLNRIFGKTGGYSYIYVYDKMDYYQHCSKTFPTEFTNPIHNSYINTNTTGFQYSYQNNIKTLYFFFSNSFFLITNNISNDNSIFIYL